MAKPTTDDLRALWATTKEAVAKRISDGITEQIPLLMEIKEAGNFKEVASGGRAFNEPAITGDSAAVGGYVKGSVLNVSEQEGIDDFQYSPAFFYGSVFMDGTELAQNAGDNAAVSLLESRIEQMKASFYNKFDEYTLGQNLVDGAPSALNTGSQEGWLGLRNIVTDLAATNIPGTGVDKAKYLKARNFVESTGAATAAVFIANNVGRTIMQNLYNGTSFGSERPRFCLMSRSIFNAFQITLQANERFIGGNSGDTKVGYPNVLYMADCRVTFGDNVANRIYMLNPKYLKLKILAKKNFKMGNFIEAYNADQEVAKMTLGGQLTTNAPRYNGVATGLAF